MRYLAMHQMTARFLAFLRPIWRRFRPKIDYRTRCEQQFRFRKWDYLEELPELSRYSIIVGYCQFFSAKTILDVGCGQGILAARLKALPYEEYLGVDFSSQAIHEARQKTGDQRTQFIIAEATEFVAPRKFDVIIFNECLYYFENRHSVLQAYVQALTPNGFMLVSMYNTFRTRAIWPVIETDMVVEDEVVVTNYVKNKAKVTYTIKKLAAH